MLRIAAGILTASLALGCSHGAAPGQTHEDAGATGQAGAGRAGGAGTTTGGGTGGASADAGTETPTAGAGGQSGASAPATDGGGADGAATETGGGAGSGGAGGAASGPCGPGTLLCEDFETYTTPADLAAAWTTTITAATMTVDATKAWHGSKALHIKAAAGTPVAVIAKQNEAPFPFPANVIFGRVMMWLTATPGGDYHWNNIQAAGTMPGATTWGKYGWGGQFGKVLAGYTVRTTQTATTATIDCSNPSASAFPSQKWVCVEWEFDGAKNELHMWFDGTLLSDVDVVGMGTRCVSNADLGKPWSAPDFSFLSLGWQQYQASNGPLELWMDDVAVGTQRVGCPATSQ